MFLYAFFFLFGDNHVQPIIVECSATWWGPLCQPTWHPAPCGAHLASAAAGPAPRSDLERAETDVGVRLSAFSLRVRVCVCVCLLSFSDSSFSFSRQHKGLTVADFEEGNLLPVTNKLVMFGLSGTSGAGLCKMRDYSSPSTELADACRLVTVNAQGKLLTVKVFELTYRKVLSHPL